MLIRFLKYFFTSITILLSLFIFNIANAKQISLPKGESGFRDNYQEKTLYETNGGNVAGNPQGSVTIIEFSDFFCIPCREISKTLDAMIKKDRWLRVVFIDYPMLGDPSIFAAKVGIAAKYQNKYLPMHHAMMNAKKPLMKDEIFYLAKQENIDTKKLVADMNGEQVDKDLLDNMFLGNAFGVKYLPAFVIGYTHSPHKTTIFYAQPQQLEELANSFKEKAK